MSRMAGFVLESSQSAACAMRIPSVVSYWVTFLSFPLNMMMISQALYVYGLLFTRNKSVRTMMLLYSAYLFLDRKRCDGVGYPDAFPFSQIRHWVRNNIIYSISCAYYPIKLHKTAELPATDGQGRECQYLFACHPHGIFGVGTMAAFGSNVLGFSKLFPGVHPWLVGLRPIFLVPFFRDLCLLGGCFSADRKSFKHVFEDRKGSAVINLGGAAESLIPFAPDPVTNRRKLKLLLKDRKGFVKVALQHGAALVPVLCLEENLMFDVVYPKEGSILHKIQLFLQKHVLGFAIVAFWGNWFPFMPKRRELNIFVGKPIMREKILDPSEEDVGRIHKAYCEGLDTLFQQSKKQIQEARDWGIEFIEHPAKQISA